MTLILNGTVGRSNFTREVALSMTEGEVLAVIGANGSGKSTIVHSIAGLVPLVSGELLVGDEIWDRPSTSDWIDPECRDCSVVFQDIRLFPHLNVERNVMYGLRSRGVSRDDARKQAAHALELVGAGHLVGRLPDDLSGGERQRVALSRAIVTKPKVLLLDEPFAAIDAASRLSLREILPGLLRELGAATLLVTHDQEDVESVASALLVL